MKDSSKSFKDALVGFLKDARLEQKFKEKKLIYSWRELMGTTIANRTKKLYVKNKVLYVSLSSSVLRHELTMAKDKMLQIIDVNFGINTIEDIVFR